MTKCLAAGCDFETALDSALCPDHKKKLDEAEAQTLRNASNAIRAEMTQFERLMLVEPPLHPAEIAHRMVWSLKKVRQTLRKFKDDRA